jgi:hypothetical protein
VTPAGEPYRKLPGHRRGFFRGASLWMAADHLLLVKSLRFREEYKRFHLRDVQAIVVASAPRFHISTRSVGIAILWWFAYLFVWLHFGVTVPMWIGAAVLVSLWILVSAAYSCRCCILTAVSRDDLPSIYRTWTARRFLRKVEPRIAEVQGRLEGDWAKPLDSRNLGPASSSGPVGIFGEESQSGNVRVSAPAAPARTLASDAFTASLFAGAAAIALTLHSSTTQTRWILNGILLLQVVAAIFIFVHHYRRMVGSGMLKLAIAGLVKMGVMYYLGVLMMGIAVGIRSASTLNQNALDQNALLTSPSFIVLRQINAATDFALGLIGIVIALRSGDPEQHRRVTGQMS